MPAAAFAAVMNEPSAKHGIPTFAVANGNFRREEAIIERLKETDRWGMPKSAIVFDEMTGTLSIGNPYLDTPVCVHGLRTKATPAEIQSITSRVTWLPETCKIITFMAQGYACNHMVGVVGPTSVGKTFCAKILAKCLHGERADLLETTISPATDPDSLVVQKAPAPSVTSRQLIAQFERLRSAVPSPIPEEAIKVMEAAIKTSKTMEQDEATHFLSCTLYRKCLGIDPPENRVRYIDQYGFIPTVFAGHYRSDGSIGFDPNRHGRGVFGIVNEINRHQKAPGVFFGVRGNGAEMATSYSSDTRPELCIPRGRDAYLVFSFNPLKEGYEGVKAMDVALLRGLQLLQVEDLSPQSLFTACRDFMAFKRGQVELDPKPSFEFYRHPEIVSVMAELVTQIHLRYRSEVQSLNKRRDQQDAPSLDDLARFAKVAARMQIPNASEGCIDMVQTATYAFLTTYLSRFDPDDAKEMEAVTRLQTHWNSLLTQLTQYQGRDLQRAQILNGLTKQAAQRDAVQQMDPAQIELATEIRRTLEDDNLSVGEKQKIAAALAALGHRI